MLFILGFLQIRLSVKQDFSNKLSFLMQQVSLYLNTKNARKMILKKYMHLVYFNYCKGKSALEIANMFSL